MAQVYDTAESSRLLFTLKISSVLSSSVFCVTKYSAAKLLEGQECAKTVYWWTLRVLLLQTGHLKTMYQRILSDTLSFPLDIPLEERSAVAGAHGSEEIKQHPFFVNIDWDGLLAKKYLPPFKPSVCMIFSLGLRICDPGEVSYIALTCLNSIHNDIPRVEAIVGSRGTVRG
ncbi:hypothetical protein C8F04DRAFT_1191733 [Mycena alexandri]|uniref:AGC-kinase C-terminal domain-containing protein n=1 Tax=Mycena alexandri TaxID=1745969 RepID=A0AAD6SGS3_9AGAR|nr:hypothetical protein C8F04DRAFT_1191733 [Mycena alexandri]